MLHRLAPIETSFESDSYHVHQLDRGRADFGFVLCVLFLMLFTLFFVFDFAGGWCLFHIVYHD